MRSVLLAIQWIVEMATVVQLEKLVFLEVCARLSLLPALWVIQSTVAMGTVALWEIPALQEANVQLEAEVEALVWPAIQWIVETATVALQERHAFRGDCVKLLQAEAEAEVAEALVWLAIQWIVETAIVALQERRASLGDCVNMEPRLLQLLL